MSELPPPGKHPDLSGLPRGAISIRGLPLGRNTRLPSIRSPRDLTLGAQPKRVFTPNIPVRREKKSVESEPEKSQTSTSKSKEPKQKPSFSPKWQKKERTIIQTEGSLFGEGIAASPSKNERPREAVPKFTSKRPAVKKEFDMSEMKSDLNGILRDDFIDDDDEYDEDDDVKPIIYPCQNDTEKIKKEITLKKKFEDEEFAKGLGFDVERIAKFIKKEKCADAAIKQDEVNMDLESDNEIYNLIKQDKHQLFLLQFPKFFAVEQSEDQQKDSSAEQKKNKAKTGLSVLPEGQIGKLQVMKSGRTRLLIGENSFYLDFSNSVKSKNEVVSIQLNESDKDIIVLGDIDHKATVVPDVDKLLESIR